MPDFLLMRWWLVSQEVSNKNTNTKVMPDESSENDPVAVNAESTREEVLDYDIEENIDIGDIRSSSLSAVVESSWTISYLQFISFYQHAISGVDLWGE